MKPAPLGELAEENPHHSAEENNSGGDDNTSYHTGDRPPQPCWGEALTAVLGITISQTQLLGDNILVTNSAGGTPGENVCQALSGELSWGNPSTQACWG
jgi:hypothetical protein